jgi:hypothetical protein
MVGIKVETGSVVANDGSWEGTIVVDGGLVGVFVFKLKLDGIVGEECETSAEACCFPMWVPAAPTKPNIMIKVINKQSDFELNQRFHPFASSKGWAHTNSLVDTSHSSLKLSSTRVASSKMSSNPSLFAEKFRSLRD